MIVRPNSIRNFEGVYWLWLVLNFVQTYLSRATATASPQAAAVAKQMPWFPYVIMAIMALLLIWLGFAIARRGSNIGRWIYVVLTVIGVGLLAYAFATGQFHGRLPEWINLASTVVAAYGAYLLFRPDAAGWFGYDDDPETIEP